MSKKARRRPSWRKNPIFYMDLINSETGELMETLRIKKKNAIFFRMIKRVGPEEMERLIVKGLEDTARKVLDDNRTKNQNT